MQAQSEQLLAKEGEKSPTDGQCDRTGRGRRDQRRELKPAALALQVNQDVRDPERGKDQDERHPEWVRPAMGVHHDQNRRHQRQRAGDAQHHLRFANHAVDLCPFTGRKRSLASSDPSCVNRLGQSPVETTGIELAEAGVAECGLDRLSGASGLLASIARSPLGRVLV